MNELRPEIAQRPAEPAPLLRLGGRVLAEWWAVLLLSTLGILAMNALLPPARADNLLYDAAQRLAPPPPSPDILVVAIDNPSLAAIGRWPWPRAVHARLIDQLTAAAPLAIGLDVLFTEPYPDPASDSALAAAMARNGRVVVPHLLEIPGSDGAASGRILPVEPIRLAARATAQAVVRPDRDGVVRGIDRLEDDAGARLPHFAEVLAALGRGEPLPADAARTGAPVLAPARDLIRFAGGPGDYPTVSYVDLLEGRVPADLVAGRLLLIGATAPGLGDRFSTPLSGTLETMAGVELHANYLDGLMADRLIRPAPVWAWQLWSVVPVWLLMLSLFYLGPRINLWVGLALSAAVLTVTVALLVGADFWLPPASALIGIGLIFPLWGWRRLDLANRYMVAELNGLVQEPTPLPRPPLEPVGDPVERQIMLMHAAVRDVRDLREFVGQSLDSLPDAALVADLDGQVLIVNDAAEALFAGRLEGPLVGRLLPEIFAVFDPDPRLPDPRARAMLDALRRGIAPTEDGYETRLADGTALEIRLAFFTDSERQPLGWILRLADITRLRASERQREDALRLLTHDMRAPQAAILAVLEAEGAAVPPALARRLERYAHQTLGLADDFVHLARAESGRYLVETFALADALLDAADDLWPLADAKRIRIRTEVPDEPLWVTADRALITRALANLLGNAVKYSADGTAIDARVFADGRFVAAEIADEGRGIAEKDLATLFEPFGRLAAPEGAAPSADAPGAGLGLAFVKTVIDRHQGRVEARSEVGRGSTFTIRLPKAA